MPLQYKIKMLNNSIIFLNIQYLCCVYFLKWSLSTSWYDFLIIGYNIKNLTYNMEKFSSSLNKLKQN